MRVRLHNRNRARQGEAVSATFGDMAMSRNIGRIAEGGEVLDIQT